MFVQAKVAGKASHPGGLREYDEYVPMVDKAVVVGCKEKQTALQNSYESAG